MTRGRCWNVAVAVAAAVVVLVGGGALAEVEDGVGRVDVLDVAVLEGCGRVVWEERGGYDRRDRLVFDLHGVIEAVWPKDVLCSVGLGFGLLFRWRCERRW